MIVLKVEKTAKKFNDYIKLCRDFSVATSELNHWQHQIRQLSNG